MLNKVGDYDARSGKGKVGSSIVRVTLQDKLS